MRPCCWYHPQYHLRACIGQWLHPSWVRRNEPGSGLQPRLPVLHLCDLPGVLSSDGNLEVAQHVALLSPQEAVMQDTMYNSVQENIGNGRQSLLHVLVPDLHGVLCYLLVWASLLPSSPHPVSQWACTQVDCSIPTKWQQWYLFYVHIFSAPHASFLHIEILFQILPDPPAPPGITRITCWLGLSASVLAGRTARLPQLHPCPGILYPQSLELDYCQGTVMVQGIYRPVKQSLNLYCLSDENFPLDGGTPLW